METVMKTIGLIINDEKDCRFEYTHETIGLLQKNGFDVLLQRRLDTCPTLPVIDSDDFFMRCDALVTLGGDGTILQIATQAARHNKPVLGVNLGHLGYLAQLEKKDLSLLPSILKDNRNFEQRFMLRLKLTDINGETHAYHALNEIVISRQITSNMVHAKLFSNDEFVYEFHSDGLIFATPTGSTAYSMSSGGPIADCCLQDIIIVTPVCEHSFFSKSMIFSASDTLSCSVVRNENSSHIVVDGRMITSAEHLTDIRIEKSEYTLSLFRPDGKRFYRVLNSKFSDGGVNEKFTT